jgi:methyl-accepting chemotaxis protein
LSPRFQLLSKAGQRVKAIDTIGTVIHKVNQIAGTMAAAVEEQDATTNEMSRKVADAAQSTSRGVDDSQQSVKELAQMSSQLRELVGQFQILAL